MELSQVAAQLCTIRDHSQTAPALAASAKRLCRIGCTAVRVSGIGPIPEAEPGAIMQGEGLAICTTHENSLRQSFAYLRPT